VALSKGNQSRVYEAFQQNKDFKLVIGGSSFIIPFRARNEEGRERSDRPTECSAPRPPQKPKTVSYTLRIDEKDLLYLQGIAESSDRSLAYIVRYAIRQFINNQRQR
jgi:hypothetical protein